MAPAQLVTWVLLATCLGGLHVAAARSKPLRELLHSQTDTWTGAQEWRRHGYAVVWSRVSRGLVCCCRRKVLTDVILHDAPHAPSSCFSGTAIVISKDMLGEPDER